MSGFSIELSDDEELALWLEGELLSSLWGELEQSLNTGFTLMAKDSTGELIGGVVAGTSYGWLLVKILWVAESHRGAGVGSALMRATEVKGSELKCHCAWLDTSNPGAYQFYSRLGYEVFGTLENVEGQFPAEHCRWFMKKALD